MEILAKGPSSKCGGNEERLGKDVDPGLLLQSSKYQRVWVEGLGDLSNLELAINGVLQCVQASCPKVGEEVYIVPFKIWTLKG